MIENIKAGSLFYILTKIKSKLIFSNENVFKSVHQFFVIIFTQLKVISLKKFLNVVKISVVRKVSVGENKCHRFVLSKVCLIRMKILLGIQWNLCQVVKMSPSEFRSLYKIWGLGKICNGKKLKESKILCLFLQY